MTRRRKKKVRRKYKVVTMVTTIDDKKACFEEKIIVYNFLAGIISVWIFFYPRPLKLAITLGMLMALIGIVIMVKYNKSIEFYKNETYSCFGIVIWLNSMVIAIRGVIYNNIIYSNLFWIYFITSCSVIVFLIIVFLRRQDFKKKLSLVILMMAILTFSTGIITNVNCLYDKSKPIVYSTVIIDMDVYQKNVVGGITVYNIYVPGWGSFNKENMLVTSKSYYNMVYVNKPIKIYLKSGLLGIKWYYAGQ